MTVQLSDYRPTKRAMIAYGKHVGIPRAVGATMDITSSRWGPGTVEMHRAVCRKMQIKATDHLTPDSFRLLGDYYGSNAKTVRLRALDIARGWVGYHEEPVNRTAFGDWYGANGEPWCAMFTSRCYDNAKSTMGNYAYVPFLVLDATVGENGLSIVSYQDMMPGDLVCYDWQQDGTTDHVEIFERWESPHMTFSAVGGNTSPTNFSNGGEVRKSIRTIASVHRQHGRLSLIRVTG